jgi:hypothetical protein
MDKASRDRHSRRSMHPECGLFAFLVLSGSSWSPEQLIGIFGNTIYERHAASRAKRSDHSYPPSGARPLGDQAIALTPGSLGPKSILGSSTPGK